MIISKLVLLVSEDCNFHCRYCYQSKEKKAMTREVLDRALDRFLPAMPESYGVFFLGGEPLLIPDLIRYTVGRVDDENRRSKKSCGYNISTNGSLVDDDWIAWFDRYRFTVELSFDGLAQDKGRMRGSFSSTLTVMNKLKSSPNLKLLVNAVFYPATVDYLADSIQFLLESGAPHISLGLDLHRRWNRPSIDKLEMQLIRLRELLFKHFQKTGTVPVDYFPDLTAKGIWKCSAGLDQVTVAADGEIWGCALFYEHFKGKEDTDLYRSFFLGSVNKKKQDNRALPEAVVENYKLLTQDNFHTQKERCFLCDHIETCGVCPIVSVAHSPYLEKVPKFICEINRISIGEKKKLFEDIAILERKKKSESA